MLRFLSCGWWTVGKNPPPTDPSLALGPGRMDRRCRLSTMSQVIGPAPSQAGREACQGAFVGEGEQLSLSEVS